MTPTPTSPSAPDVPKTDVERVIAGIRAVIGTAKSPRAHQRLISETGVQIERAGVVALAILADRGPLRLSELAAALQVDISTASRQVRGLEADGLIARTPDDHDRRATLLSLSERGHAAQIRLRAHWHERMGAALVDLSPEDRATLADLLERFAAGLQRTIGEPR